MKTKIQGKQDQESTGQKFKMKNDTIRIFQYDILYALAHDEDDIKRKCHAQDDQEISKQSLYFHSHSSSTSLSS